MYTVKDIKQVLENYKKNKSFLDVRDFYKFAKCLVFITYKGTGKSWSAMESCVEQLKDGKEFAWVRNSDTEIKLSKVGDSFMTILRMYKVSDYYKVKDNGLYEVNPEQYNDKGKLVGIFSNMTKPYNTASQNALTKCNLIVYDEFINPTFHKKNLFSDFMKLAHTLMRKNEAHIILLGNKHESNNDILAELGIEFDWENKENQIIYRPDQDLLALYLDKWEIEGMKNSNDLVEKLSKYSPSMQQFSSGGISSNNMGDVKNWYIHKIQDNFKPIFRFDLRETRYCVGEINSIENKSVYGVDRVCYIKLLDYDNEFNNTPTYCYHPQDKRSDNRYIYDIEDFKTVEYLMNRYAKGEMFYSHAYAKNDFKVMLPFLRMILLNQDK